MIELTGVEPISTNEIWRKGRHGHYKIQKAKQFTSEVARQLKANPIGELTTADAIAIELEFKFPSFQYFTKRGSIRRIDLDNLIKPAIDAIFQHLGSAYGVDDSQVTSIRASKSPSTNDSYSIGVKILREVG